jgi:hypothetical protein
VRKTLTVIGAGASVDCFSAQTLNGMTAGSGNYTELGLVGRKARDVAAYMPPLTANLVLSLQAQGAGCAQLLEVLEVERLNAPKTFDFEATLRRLYDKYGSRFESEYLALRYTIRSRMALADEIGKDFSTLYTVFFGMLRASDFGDNREYVVLNLNYDRLAERALSKRVGFNSIEQYIDSTSEIKLLHPHGNCGWGLADLNISAINATTPEYNFGLPELVVEPRQGNSSQDIALRKRECDQAFQTA